MQKLHDDNCLQFVSPDDHVDIMTQHSNEPLRRTSAVTQVVAPYLQHDYATVAGDGQSLRCFQ